MSPPYLHGVVRVLVVEDQGFLDELVVALQLVDVVLVVDDVVLILLQLVHLVLQGPCDLDGAPSDLLYVGGQAGYEGALSEWGNLPERQLRGKQQTAVRVGVGTQGHQ